MADSYDAQNMAIVLQNLGESILALRADTDSIHEMMADVLATLRGISHMLAKEYLQDDLVTPYTLTSNDLRIDRQGRRYMLIFTPTNISNVAANVLGITGYTFTLNAGWTILNLPDGTIIKAPNTTSQPILIKATNWVQSGAI